MVRWLPIGSWEPHSSHLPYDTDTRIATHLAQEAADGEDIILPALGYGCSFEHREMGSPVSLHVATFVTVVSEIAHSSKIPLVIVNAHGGNTALESLSQELNAENIHTLVLPHKSQWAQAFKEVSWPFTPHDDMHAGALETSLMWAWEPDMVRLPVPQDHTADNRSLFSALGMAGYTTSGVIGLPEYASAQLGQQLITYFKTAMRLSIKEWLHG